MNELQIFNNEEFGEIRMVEIEGKPYFMASDIAKALGYARPNDAISAHCKATVKHSIPISGKMQEVNFIPEGDIYRLIIKSQLPAAERFESWVFDEVIPSIRKTGSYNKPMSQLELMQMSINQLVEQEKRMNSIESRMDMIEAKSITRPVDYYTIAGFASIKNLKVNISQANFLGRKATALSKKYGYDIDKVSDPRYGTVNAYHVDILNEVIGGVNHDSI